MTKFDRIRQEWPDFIRQAALTGLVFVLFGCAVGLVYGVLALIFGWVSLASTVEVLLHCSKIAAFAVVGAACLYVFRHLRRKAAKAASAPTAVQEPASAPESPAEKMPPVAAAPVQADPQSKPASPQAGQRTRSISFDHGPSHFVLCREEKGLHLMCRPSDRFDWSPIVDDWLTPDYFKTHDVDAFCTHVENRCNYPNTKLDRREMTQRLIAQHFIDPPCKAAPPKTVAKTAPPAPHGGDEQHYAATKPYLLWLGDAHLQQQRGWGQTEYYALDTRSGTPHYIVEQYDGRAVAHCWFETYRPVSWDEVKEHASGLQLEGVHQLNWRESLFKVSYNPARICVGWHNGLHEHRECSITFRGGAFHLTNHGFDPDERSGSSKTIELQPKQLCDRDAFRAALSHPYDAVFRPLWDFVQKQLAAPAPKGKGNDDLTWTLQGVTLTVRGTGKLESLWNASDIQRRSTNDPHNLGPWFDQPGFDQKEATHVHTLKLDNGVTGIAFLALRGMKNLREIHIPASVTDMDLRPDSRFVICTADHTAAAAFARQHDVPLGRYVRKASDDQEDTPSQSFRKIASVQVSHVPQPPYWRSDAALLFNGKEWSLELTDVFAIDRWGDDDASCLIMLPDDFPAFTADRLAALINRVPSCGPAVTSRKVSASEVLPLIDAARAESH